MKAIMLILTENCNLACRYCYEHGDNRNMTFDTAKSIIDRELQAESGETFKLFFFGGEPFVNFELLEQVYQYAETYYPGRVEKYAVTTNGTLIHGAIRTWLYERKDKFEITLSLDGTKEMHDRSRINKNGKGSFDLVDLKFFSETWPGCVVKMTISPATINDFAKGIIYIEQMGFKCKANFASGMDFKLEENKEIILQNFLELASYYSANDNPLCYMLDLPLQAVLVPLDDRFRYCGAGVERHCYEEEADGWYPCQGLMPMSVPGREKTFKYETFSESSVLESSPCRSCRFVRICRTCYAMNYNATKNVYQPDKQTCMLNQMCMLTSARIQYTRLKKSGLTDGSLERAVYLIAKELNSVFGG